jgi:hypothetical protein
MVRTGKLSARLVRDSIKGCKLDESIGALVASKYISPLENIINISSDRHKLTLGIPKPCPPTTVYSIDTEVPVDMYEPTIPWDSLPGLPSYEDPISKKKHLVTRIPSSIIIDDVSNDYILNNVHFHM